MTRCLGFKGLGFRGLGVQGLGFRSLGFRILRRSLEAIRSEIRETSMAQRPQLGLRVYGQR